MKIGKGSRISDKASIYNPENLIIGDNVRIDDFVILSCGAGMSIGDHVHIAAYGGYFAAQAPIILGDFSQFAARVTILGATDDFSGESLVGPCVPDSYKPGLHKARVTVCRHALIGVGSVVMPGVTIHEGAAVGAMSFVKQDCMPWVIYGGVPAVRIGRRSTKMLTLEENWLKELTR